MGTYLGLDLGTSATKAIIVSDSGEVVARARATHPESRRGLVGRVDSQAWAQSVHDACRQLGPALAGVAGVGIDTHCPTVIPLGRQGTPAGLGITWDNPQLTRYFRRHGDDRSAAEIAATGNRPSPSTFMAIAHSFLKEEEPETFAAMTTLGLAGTWLGQLLTGTSAIDPTQASYTGVYDTTGDGLDWLPGALEAMQIDPAVLPPLREPISILGTVTPGAAQLLGVPTDLPVAVGCADTPAASYVLGTAPGTQPFLIIGTTHVVNSCLEGPDRRSLALQRRGLRPGEWLINGVTNGGDALATAARCYGFGDAETAVRELIRTAAQVGPAEAEGAPFFVPHVMAERGPFWFDAARSGMTGMNRNTTRGQVARALLEGVIFADRMVLESTIPVGDEPIYLTGAFGVDQVIPQLLADATRRSFDLVVETDLPSLGAAGICAEAVAGTRLPAPNSTRVLPRDDRSDLDDRRWDGWTGAWSQVTGQAPIAPI
ncbi:MAG: FGGY family carbohydrate kinase [Micropruina sp.]|uniref:xylulokinase n=1 Tax=Micropruina sp. TaxID=2737536 RepID=UPI0039E2DA14